MKKFFAAVLMVALVITCLTMVSMADGERAELSFNFIKGVRDFSRNPYAKAGKKVLFDVPVTENGYVVKYFNNGAEIKADITSPVEDTVALPVKEGYNIYTAKFFTADGAEVPGSESAPLIVYGTVYVGELEKFTAQVVAIDASKYREVVNNPAASPKEKEFVKSLMMYDEKTQTYGRTDVTVSVGQTTATNSPCQRIKPPFDKIWTVQYELYLRDGITEPAQLNQVRVKQPSDAFVGDPFNVIIQPDNSIYCNAYDTLVDIIPNQWNAVEMFATIDTDSLDFYYNDVLIIKDYDMGCDIDYCYANNVAGFSTDPHLFYYNQLFGILFKHQDLPDLSDVVTSNRATAAPYIVPTEFSADHVTINVEKKDLPRAYRAPLMFVAVTEDGRASAKMADFSLVDSPEITTIQIPGQFKKVAVVRLPDYRRLAYIDAP